MSSSSRSGRKRIDKTHRQTEGRTEKEEEARRRKSWRGRRICLDILPGNGQSGYSGEQHKSKRHTCILPEICAFFSSFFLCISI